MIIYSFILDNYLELLENDDVLYQLKPKVSDDLFQIILEEYKKVNKDAELDKVYLPLILSGRILPLTNACVDWVKLHDKYEKQIDNEISTLVRKFTKPDYDVRVGFTNYKADRYICPPEYNYVFDKSAKAIDYFSQGILSEIHISGEFVSEFDVQKYKLKIIGGGIRVRGITYYPLVSLEGVDPMETVYNRIGD